MHQCKAKITYLSLSELKGQACVLHQIASLSHPLLGPVSPLPVSQLACQVSHDPLLLYCSSVLRGFRTAGMRCGLLGLSCCDPILLESVVFSLVLYCPALSIRGPASRPAPWLKCVCILWKLEEVQQCRRGWVSSKQAHRAHSRRHQSPVILAGCHRD